MKHVFGISSHLAFYLCLRVIEQDSLKSEDCLFFTICGYTLPGEYSNTYPTVVTTYNTSPLQGRIFEGWRFWNTKKNIAEVDNLLTRHIGQEDFVWYTQVCFNDICSVMVTNPHCVGYYIIEDGSGSYLPENPATFRGVRAIIFHGVLKPLFPRIFTLKNHFVEINHPKFKGCIASNSKCFPLYSGSLRVVGLPFHAEPLTIVPDAIISIDPLFRWGVKDDQAKQIICQLANFINQKRYKRIAYKHHPAILSPLQKERYQQYNSWVHEYVDGDLEELSANISLENTLMAHPRADFYTAVSTVAIYANAMGVKCYTYCPLLRQFCDKSLPIVEKFCTPINPK